VIIPSYNRKKILKKCLASLFEQTYPKDEFEIVIADDCSQDGTEEMVREIIPKAEVRIKYFRHERNSGGNAARNTGVRSAEGEVTLFIGDDIIADRNLLREHIKYYEEYPDEDIAVLGKVFFYPEIETPFMNFMQSLGYPFSYPEKEGDVSSKYLLTCNASVRRKLLIDIGMFDQENFWPPSVSTWEDTEMAYRLARRGSRFIYDTKAIGYHYHPMDYEAYRKRMEIAGRAAVILARVVPEARGDAFYLSPFDARGVAMLKEIAKRAVFNEFTEPFFKAIVPYLGFNRFSGVIYSQLLQFYFRRGVKKGTFAGNRAQGKKIPFKEG